MYVIIFVFKLYFIFFVGIIGEFMYGNFNLNLKCWFFGIVLML